MPKNQFGDEILTNQFGDTITAPAPARSQSQSGIFSNLGDGLYDLFGRTQQADGDATMGEAAGTAAMGRAALAGLNAFGDSIDRPALRAPVSPLMYGPGLPGPEADTAPSNYGSLPLVTLPRAGQASDRLAPAPGQYTSAEFEPVMPSQAAGMYNAAAPIAEQLTTPYNLGTAAATGGMGGAALAGSVPARMAIAGVSAGFGGMMAVDTVKAAKEAQSILENPDATSQQKAQAVATPILTGVMSLAALAGAGRIGAGEAIPRLNQAYPELFWKKSGLDAEQFAAEYPSTVRRVAANQGTPADVELVTKVNQAAKDAGVSKGDLARGRIVAENVEWEPRTIQSVIPESLKPSRPANNIAFRNAFGDVVEAPVETTPGRTLSLGEQLDQAATEAAPVAAPSAAAATPPIEAPPVAGPAAAPDAPAAAEPIYETRNQNLVQAGPQEQPGSTGANASGLGPSQIQSGLEEPIAWLQAFSGNDPEALANTAAALGRKSVSASVLQGPDVLEGINAFREALRAPGDYGANIGSTAEQIGGRAPQGQQWAQQFPGQSGDSQPGIARGTSPAALGRQMGEAARMLSEVQNPGAQALGMRVLREMLSGTAPGTPQRTIATEIIKEVARAYPQPIAISSLRNDPVPAPTPEAVAAGGPGENQQPAQAGAAPEAPYTEAVNAALLQQAGGDQAKVDQTRAQLQQLEADEARKAQADRIRLNNMLESGQNERGEGLSLPAKANLKKRIAAIEEQLTGAGWPVEPMTAAQALDPKGWNFERQGQNEGVLKRRAETLTNKYKDTEYQVITNPRGDGWAIYSRPKQTPKSELTEDQRRQLRAIAVARKTWKRVGDGPIYPPLEVTGVTPAQFKQLERGGWVENRGFGHDVTMKGMVEIDEALRKSLESLGRSKPAETAPSEPQGSLEERAASWLKVEEPDATAAIEATKALRQTLVPLQNELTDLVNNIKALGKQVLRQNGNSWERGKVKASAPAKLVRQYNDLLVKQQRLGQTIAELQERGRANAMVGEIDRVRKVVNNLKLPLIQRLGARMDLYGRTVDKIGPEFDQLGQLFNEAAAAEIRKRHPDATDAEVKTLSRDVERNAADLDRGFQLDPGLNIQSLRTAELKDILKAASHDIDWAQRAPELAKDLDKYLGHWGPYRHPGEIKPLSRAELARVSDKIKSEETRIRAILEKERIEAEALAAKAAEAAKRTTVVTANGIRIEADAPTERQVSKLADKKKLIVQKEFLEKVLADLIEQAPPADATREDLINHTGRIHIEVPGDGSFTVFNSKETLTRFADDIRKFYGSGLKLTKQGKPQLPSLSEKELAESRMTPEQEIEFAKEKAVGVPAETEIEALSKEIARLRKFGGRTENDPWGYNEQVKKLQGRLRELGWKDPSIQVRVFPTARGLLGLNTRQGNYFIGEDGQMRIDDRATAEELIQEAREMIQRNDGVHFYNANDKKALKIFADDIQKALDAAGADPAPPKSKGTSGVGRPMPAMPTPPPGGTGTHAHGSMTVALPRITPGQIKIQEVYDSLENVMRAIGLDTPIRHGRMSQRNALGIFKTFSEVIRTKQEYDIPTAAHEVAHALSKRVFGSVMSNALLKSLPSKPIAKELQALGHALYGSTRPVAGYTAEGFSELVRLWLTTEDAIKKAPLATAWLEKNILAGNPALNAAMRNARDKVDLWRGQGAMERMNQQTAREPGRIAKATAMLKNALTKRMLIEEFSPLEELAEGYEKITGTPLAVDKNPSLIAQAYRRTAGAVLKQWVNDGVTDVAGNVVGPSLREAFARLKPEDEEPFHAYLFAKQALVRLDQGKFAGIERADAEWIVKQLETPAYIDAASKVAGFWKAVRNYKRNAYPEMNGPMIDAIEKANPVYYGPLAAEIDPKKVGRSAANRLGGGLYRFKGHGGPTKRIYEQSLLVAENIIGSAQRDMVLRSVVALRHTEGLGWLAEQVPVSKVMEGVNIEKLRHQMEAWGVDTTAIPPDTLLEFATQMDAPKGSDPIIAVRENGKPVWLQVPREVQEVLQGVHDPERLGAVFELLVGGPTRIFKLGTTGLRAGFSIITNPQRDFMTYMMQSLEPNPVRKMAALMNAYRQLLMEAFGGNPGPYLRAFHQMGISGANFLGGDIAQAKREAKGLFHGKFFKVVHSPIESLRELLSFTEAAPRLAEVELGARRFGWDPTKPLTPEQAIQIRLAAKRVTTDFSAKGGMPSELLRGGLGPFFGAGMQGARGFGRTWKDKQGTFRRNRPILTGLLNAVSLITLPMLWNWYNNRNKEWYRMLPWRERYLYINIEQGNNVIQIPLPQEWGITFGVLPVAAIDSLWRHDPKPVEEALKHAFAVLNPVDWPTPISAIFEQKQNRNEFFNQPIVPRSEVDLIPGAQQGPYTSWFAKSLGNAFPNILSPRRIDAAIREVFGDAGADYTRTPETLMGALGLKVQPRESEAADMPIIGRQFRHGGTFSASNQSITDFWDDEQRYGARLASAREAVKAGNAPIIPMSLKEQQYAGMLQGAAPWISTILKIANATPDTGARQRLYRFTGELAEKLTAARPPVTTGFEPQ